MQTSGEYVSQEELRALWRAGKLHEVKGTKAEKQRLSEALDRIELGACPRCGSTLKPKGDEGCASDDYDPWHMPFRRA